METVPQEETADRYSKAKKPPRKITLWERLYIQCCYDVLKDFSIFSKFKNKSKPLDFDFVKEYGLKFSTMPARFGVPVLVLFLLLVIGCAHRQIADDLPTTKQTVDINPQKE